MPATEGHDAQPADEQQLLGEVESMSLSQNRNENVSQNNAAPNNGAQSGADSCADEEPIFRPNIRRMIEAESDPEDESQRPTINIVIDEDADDSDEQHPSVDAGGSAEHSNGLPEHQDHDYAIVGGTQPRGNNKDSGGPPIPTIPPLDEYFSEHSAQDQIIPAEVKYVSSRQTDAHRHGINLSSYRPTQTQPTRIVTRQPIGSPQQAYRPRDFVSSSQERRTTLVPTNASPVMPRRSAEIHQRRSLEETPRSLPPSNLRRPLATEGRLVPASSNPSVEPARPANANQHAPFIVPASGPKYMNRSRTVRQRADQGGVSGNAYVHYDHAGPRKSDSPAKTHESPTRLHTSPYHQLSSPAQPTPESTLIDVVQEEEEQNAKFFQQQQRHPLMKGMGGAKARTQAPTSASSSSGQQRQAAQQQPVGSAVEQIPTATSGTTLTPLTQELPVDSAITSPPSHPRPYEPRPRTVSETAVPLGQQVPQYASSRSPQHQDVYTRPTIMRNRQPASTSGYPVTDVRVEVPISGGLTQTVTAHPMDDGMRQSQRDLAEHRRAGSGLSPQRGVPRYEYYDSPRTSGGSPQMRHQHLLEEHQRPMVYNDQQGAPADEFAYGATRSGLAELAHASQITQRHISSPPRYAEGTPAYRPPLAYASPERAGNFVQEADSSGGLGHQPHEYPPGRRALKRDQSPTQQHAAQEPRNAEILADSTEAHPRRRGRRRTQEAKEVAKEEEEWGDYTTRCFCGLQHNDPFMIQCDNCSVWQHGLCMGVDEKKVPEKYYCELCAPRTLKHDYAKARAMQEELLERVRKHANSQKKGLRGRKSVGATKPRRMSKEDHRERAASRNESRVSSHSSTGAEQQVENKLSRSLRSFVNNHQHNDKGDVHLLDALVRNATKELIVAPGIKGLVSTKKGGFQAGEPIIEYRAHLNFVIDNPERFNVAPKNGIIYRGLDDDEKLAIYADASKASSEARSTRRSCQPNAKIRHAIRDGRLHLLLVATEPIDDTEEITIPFEKEYQLSSTPVSCACGATDNANPSKPCPIRTFNESLVSGKLLPNGNDQHSAAEGGTPKRRGLITVGPSHAPKTAPGSTGRGRPGRPRKNESPERTPPARRVGPFKTGSRYLESTERKKTPQDETETKESSPPTTIASQRRGSESAKAESTSESSSPKPEPRRSNRSRGTSSSMQAPQVVTTETVPEPSPKPEDDAKPSLLNSPPPVVFVDQPKSELPAISPREARKLQQEEKLFEKIEQQQKRKETHKHPGEKLSSSESQKAAAPGNRPSRRSAQSDASEEPTAKRGKTSIASDIKRRSSISEEQESKKAGKKAKVVSTQPAPEKLVAETALPPSQMVTPSRRLRTNTRTEPTSMEVDGQKPATSTPRADLRAARGGDGAALKRQISQQEAAHVLAEMARNHSPPTSSSPLQLDVGSSQNTPLYPRISPTAESRGLGAMLCRLAVASGAANQNDFNLPPGFPGAPTAIKVPEPPPPPAKQAKKISIAEYKSRRGTMTSTSGTSPSTMSTDHSSSPRARPTQPAKRQSFIPNIADTSAYTAPLDVPVPVSLDDLKKRILTTTSGTYLGTSPTKEPADSPSVSMTATADSTTGEPTPSGSATRSAGSTENNVVSSTTPTPTEPLPAAPIRAVSVSGGQRPSLEDRLKTVFGLDVKAKAQPPPEPAPPARRFSQRKFEDRSREAVPPPRQLPTCPIPADRQLHADSAQVGPGLQSTVRR